jgi:hypothetical protein
MDDLTSFTRNTPASRPATYAVIGAAKRTLSPCDRVTLTLHPHHDFYHGSLLISAVAASQSRHVTTRIDIDPWRHPIVPMLDLDGVRYAIDLADSSSFFAEGMLERCDWYAKRSFLASDVPAAARGKVIPFGLNYACRTRAGVAAMARLMATEPIAIGATRPWMYTRQPRASEFEYPPSLEADPVIAFQTRIWSDAEVGGHDSAEEVNGSRVALIVALRREFGGRFRGGLVPTALAKRRYPKAITNEPHRSSAYLHWSRRALVAVTTRGLQHSHPFKIGEYLAASSCIVTEPLRNQLPVPLVDGENIRVFHTVDECLGQCAFLLEHPGQASEMRAANWDYYSRYVRADRRLDLLLAH